MEYRQFEEILDSKVLQGLKSDLINKLAKHPEKYAGLFVPIQPETKLTQSIWQLKEIKFNNTFTDLIEKYLKDAGFKILNKRLLSERDKELQIDQLFTDGTTIYFVEQKIRDDHNSIQKTTYITSFSEKLSAIKERYKKQRIVGFFYFIDDSFNKNKKFYAGELAALEKKHNIELHLSYGAELFSALGKDKTWKEMLMNLDRWKAGVPEFPDINFDEDAEASHNEIKELPFRTLAKLFLEPGLDKVLSILFPKAKTLELLHQWFEYEYTISTGHRKKSLAELIPLSEAAIRRIQNKNKDKKSH